MENEPSGELSHLELRSLYRMLAGRLILDPGSELDAVDIRGVNQPHGERPYEFSLQIDPELYAEAFKLDPEVSVPTSVELSFTQKHVIDEYPNDRPVAPQVVLNTYRQDVLSGEVVNINEWFVVSDPDAEETLDGDSYVAIEYSRPNGEKLILTNKSFKTDLIGALSDDIELSRRPLNQDDALHLYKFIQLTEQTS